MKKLCYLNPRTSWLGWAGLFLLAFFMSACSEKPEKYLQKAAVALQKEDSAQADEYFKKAYLLSLGKKFFPLGHQRKFHGLEIDGLGEHILMTAQEDNEWEFWLINTEGKKIRNESHTGFIEQAVISASGEYLLFSYRPKKENSEESNAEKACGFYLFQPSAKKGEEIPLSVSCEQLPAIDDNGEIVFAEEGTLKKYNSRDSRFDERFTTKLAYSISSITPKVSLFFSPARQLFASYGLAGMYNIYKIENGSAKKLSSTAAYSRLLFVPSESLVVLVEGGAGKRKLVFKRESDMLTVKTTDISGLSDFSFISSSHFYALEKNRIKEYSAGMITSLPFFAETIRSDAYQQLYFLTPEGVFMKFSQELPSAEAMDIFTKIQELYN